MNLYQKLLNEGYEFKVSQVLKTSGEVVPGVLYIEIRKPFRVNFLIEDVIEDEVPEDEKGFDYLITKILAVLHWVVRRERRDER